MLHRTYKAPASQGSRKSFTAIMLILVIVIGSAGAYSVWIRPHQTTVSASKSPVSARTDTAEEPLKPANATVPETVAVPAITHDVSIPPITKGLAPVIIRLATKEPVVFLGMDDGANKQAFELQMMKDNGIKASLFLANRFIKDNSSFFKDFVTAGSLVEDHTIDHKLLSNLNYADQKQEICGEADLQFQQFGRRPNIFRPPGGNYNTDTQRAAAACGMKAVVLWIAKANGGSMQYQIGHTLKPGDIVLMHFRPEFAKDMQSFLNAEKAAGLHTELLEDWLP